MRELMFIGFNRAAGLALVWTLAVATSKDLSAENVHFARTPVVNRYVGTSIVSTTVQLDKDAHDTTQMPFHADGRSDRGKFAKPETKPAEIEKEARSPSADLIHRNTRRSASAAQSDFYRPDRVQSVYVRVAKEDLRRMLEALPERIYVPASFRWRDISFAKVAIRFKGGSSSHPDQRHKRSYLVKFNEYDDSQRFLGMRRVSFDNGVQFGSLFSEPIITGILRDHGIKTHRCNYAKLYLNDEYQGVYVNVERIDESFLENHLPDASGALYKIDQGGPGANLQFLGDNPSAYKHAFEAKNKSAKKQRARLVEFIRLINKVDEDNPAAKLQSKMELDDFLSVTAVMLLSGAFDQLTGWNPHNYYLYHDAIHDRWRYLPWDLDVGFCETAFGRVHVLVDWNAAWPIPASGPPNPLLERIVADPELLQRYRKVARKVLNESFEPKRLCAIIDAKYELIKDDLRTDPFPHQRATVPGDRDYDDIVESMKQFVRKRYDSALQQLENPGTRPEVVYRRPDSRPGTGPPGVPPRLVAKIHRMQRSIQQMQQNGRDISRIHRRLQRVGPLLQQGRPAEAEKIIDEVLKLTGENPAEPAVGTPQEEKDRGPSSGGK